MGVLRILGPEGRRTSCGTSPGEIDDRARESKLGTGAERRLLGGGGIAGLDIALQL